MEHPPFHPVPLTEEAPTDVSHEVTYRGTRRLYAQLRYGTPDSRRVAVVVDEVGPGAFDLYVDRNRNQTIEPAERVRGDGAVRRLRLDVELVREQAVKHVARTVLLRRGIVGTTLGIATVGYVEGAAEINGQRALVRRVDGEGNGLFADARDRVWLKRPGDITWDPIAGQFPYTPVLRLDGRRFAVRADAVGARLAFEEIVCAGRLKVHLPGLARNARVQQLQVMLVGEDGSAFTLPAGDAPAMLPVGRYGLASVTLSVLDSTAPEPWTFVFSRSGGEPPQRWYEVRKEQEVSVDPIGQLRFELRLPDAAVPPGKEVSVSPRLYTGDGLLINASGRGEIDPYSASDKHNCATVQLVSATGTVLGAAQSGFA